MEIEKGLSGASGSGKSNDGGTSTRSMSQLLKFLSDGRPDDLYFLATCNNIDNIDAAWLRAERWDGAPIMVDLPNLKAREAIFDFYLEKYEVKKGKMTMKDCKGFSGAEIKSLCRKAKMQGKTCDLVKDFIIPISVTMSEEIERLRTWSKGRTTDAANLPVNKVKTKKRKIAL